MSVHFLHKRIMGAWVEYSASQEQAPSDPTAGFIHLTKNEEEADKTDNEDIGAFCSSSPTMSAGLVEQSDFKDTLD